jgi:small subunit ribosomal protein S17
MTEKKTKDIGVDVKPPKKTCEDPNCPFHGNLKVRGQILEGKVVRDKAHQTVIVEKESEKYHKKYERYERRVARYSVFNPKCIGATTNDNVKIMECRPISKSKSFVVIEVA